MINPAERKLLLQEFLRQVSEAADKLIGHHKVAVVIDDGEGVAVLCPADSQTNGESLIVEAASYIVSGSKPIETFTTDEGGKPS